LSKLTNITRSKLSNGSQTPPAMGLAENRVIIMFPMLRQARIDLREPSRNRDVPMNQPRLGINSQERDGEIIVPAPQNLRIDL
jgi:hypothetical protein